MLVLPSSYDSDPVKQTSNRLYTIFGGWFVLFGLGLIILAYWLLGNHDPSRFIEPPDEQLERPRAPVDLHKKRLKWPGRRALTRAELHEKRLELEYVHSLYLSVYAAKGPPLPLMHEMITYLDGYKNFNKSVPIELQSDEYLGEFGVRIAALNVYARDKVAALEVWLFDKADAETASGILASDQILTDPLRTEELKAQGTVREVQPNTVLQLSTNTLRLRT